MYLQNADKSKKSELSKTEILEEAKDLDSSISLMVKLHKKL